MFKRSLAILLCLCLLVTMLPVTALAEMMPERERKPVSAASEKQEKPTETTESVPQEEAGEPVPQEETEENTEEVGGRPIRTQIFRDEITGQEGLLEQGDYLYRVITLDSGEKAAAVALYNGTAKKVKIPAAMGGYPVVCLEEYAFFGNYDIQSVEIPEGVTELQTCVFESSSVTQVTLPQSLKIIGDYAFYDCQGLQELVLPKNLESIGDSAFACCYGLKKIVLPAGLETIGDYAFASCYGLKKIVLPAGLETVGEYAFESCDRLTELTIPASVTQMGRGIISGCSNLKEITLADGLTTLVEGVFEYSYLERLELPDSIVDLTPKSLMGLEYTLKYVKWTAGIPEIPDLMFYNFGELEEVVLPAGVTAIGSEVFFDCYKLKKIHLPDTLTSIGRNAFYDCWGLQELVLPKNLESIGDSAFACCYGLKKIVLPEGLETIGEYAFEFCDRLTELTIPASVTQMGRGIISGCSNLKEITLADGLTTLVEGVFEYSYLERLELPDSIVDLTPKSLMGLEYTLKYVKWTAGIPEIPDGMFYDFGELEEVVLPAGVTAIGGSDDSIGVFDSCYALTRISMPKSLTSIGRNAFYDCQGLQELVLPKNLESIGDSAFAYCCDLEKIVLPAGLETIGDYAFSWCTALTTLELPDSLKHIGSCAFESCTALDRMTLPANLETAGSGLFYDCTSLTEISFAKGTTTILPRIFEGSCIERLELPDTITELTPGSFSGLENTLRYLRWTAGMPVVPAGVCLGLQVLETVALPENVTEIGQDAFKRCSFLRNIHLPEGLTTIGPGAFAWCTSLSEMELPQTLTTIGAGAFDQTGITTLVLPDSVVDARMALSAMTNLKHLVVGEGIQDLSVLGIDTPDSLETVVLPEGMTEIPACAFWYAPKLYTVTLPDTLTTIGSCAFYESGLKVLTLPDSVTTIEGGAFSYCEQLEEIRFGRGVTEIDEYAFDETTDFLAWVWPGSYAEEYVIAHNIPYVHMTENTPSQTGGVVTVRLNADLYSGMELVLSAGGQEWSRLISGQTEYVFTGLIIGADCTVSVRDQKGEVVMNAGTLTVTNDSDLAVSDAQDLGYVTLKVLDRLGRDQSAHVQVSWFDAAGKPLATGMVLSGLTKGTKITGRIRLDETLGKEYSFPQDITLTVAKGKNAQTINLEKLPTRTISGTVASASGVLAGAVVSVVQKVNGEYEIRSNATADRQGVFRITVPSVQGKITVHADGYVNTVKDLAQGTQNLNLGKVEMKPLTGAKISLSISTRQKAGDDKGTALNHLDDLKITIRNKTKNTAITAFQRQGMGVVITQGASAGDTLELRFASISGEYGDASVTVTLDSGMNASASVMLTIHGTLEITANQGSNDGLRALVYGADGVLAAQRTASVKDGKLDGFRLPDGTYTLVVLGESMFFTHPDTLDGLTQAGLKAGTDYVSRSVTMKAGTITKADVGVVPQLDLSRFYYTDPNKTLVTTSKTTISAGKFFTLRAHTAFAEKYQKDVSSIRWIIDLPEGTELYPGTLSVDRVNVAFSQAQNVLTVPVKDPAHDLRLCVLATGQGVVQPVVYLEFDYQGKTIRQPVGTVKVAIDAFDFDVTPMTYSPDVTVYGTAAANAEITMYDNGVVAGQTAADANGRWMLTFALLEPGTVSEHRLSAEMTTSGGTRIRSAAHTVVYWYTHDPASVSRISMYYAGDPNPSTPTSVLDFKNGTVIDPAYTVNGAQGFTFVVEFDCEDVTLLSDVVVEVTTDTGALFELSAVYDEGAGGFVASGDITDGLPENVAVRYAYGGALVFSPEHVKQLQAKQQEKDQALKELEDIGFESFGSYFGFFENYFDDPVYSDVFECPEDFDDTVTERNNLLKDLIEAELERDRLYKEIYGDITETDNGVSMSGGAFEADIEMESLGAFNISDMIDAGYSVHLNGDGTDGLTLTKQEYDQNTGGMKQTTISVPKDAVDPNTIGKVPGGSDGTPEYKPSVTDGKVTIQNTPPSVCPTGTVGHGEKLTVTMNNAGTLDSFDTSLLNEYAAAVGTVSALSGLFQAAESKVLGMAQNIVGKAMKTVEALPGDQSAMLKKLGELSGHYDDLQVRADKAWGALKAVGKSVGAFMNGVSMGLDINDFMEMKKIYEETGDMDALIAMILLGIDIGMNICSFGLLFFPGFGWLLDIAVIAMAYAVSQITEDQVKLVKERYKNRNGLTGSNIIDPSGYVYEAVASNRLPGVTVTCYERVTRYDIYEEPYDEVQFWDASPYDQVNPLVTDQEGRYAWDVPEGWWQVKAELDGYETVYSEWLPVPPPQLEVNLGMVSYEVPWIEAVYAQPRSVEIVFGKYMQVETLTEGNIILMVDDEEISGNLELVNEEASPTDPSRVFASRVRFVPDQTLSVGQAVQVTVSGDLLSYAGVAIMDGESGAAIVRAAVESITVASTTWVDYPGEAEITIQALPASAAAGKTLRITGGDSALISLKETSVVLDKNGCAVIHVTGVLPGTAELTFSVDRTELTAKTRVVVGASNAHEHSWGGWTVVKAPTSSETGMQERVCTGCGETERQDIPKLDVCYGDTNGDGRVNGLDLILLRQYLAGWDVEPNLSAADTNGDTRVNGLDLILLRQYLAGWDVTLGPKAA